MGGRGGRCRLPRSRSGTQVAGAGECGGGRALVGPAGAGGGRGLSSGNSGTPLARADPLTGSPWKNQEFRESPWTQPSIRLCVEPAGLCGRCPGVAVPLCVVPSPTGLPSNVVPLSHVCNT